MLKFIQRFFAPATPAPARPMATRCKRINPDCVLVAKRKEGVTGQVSVQMTEICRGSDGSST